MTRLDRAQLTRIAGALLLVLALPILARHEGLLDYYLDVGITTIAFLVALAFFARFDGAGRAIARASTGVRVPLLAAVYVILAAAAALLVFENVPHVSDEVAYQFQARAMATGRLWISPPANFEFFDFLHTINDGTKWYGIMNPGWPLMLAGGYTVNLPWIINPLLGAATLPLLFAFLRKADYSDLEARLAVILLAVSPFTLFMAGTYMAHTANLFLFVLFLWAWISLIKSERWYYAAIAGLALAVNLLVRPLDIAAVSAPFLLFLLVHVFRKPKLWPHLILLGTLAATGVGLTWLYNQQLTGDWRLMPMTKYFTDLNPNEKFGLGFGADMGTKIHGAEWPGYYPIDAVRVTSLRLMELLNNLYGLPAVAAGALLLGMRLRKRGEPSRMVHLLLLASAASLIGLYVFHFYHGIAYGSRHYFLALPAIVVALAHPLAGWLRDENQRTARLARAALAALLLCTAAITYPKLVSEYGRNYRGSSGALRDAVAHKGLTNAVVLVAQDTKTWAWKSAFPLNEYPLESSTVVYAKDLDADNQRLIGQFPTRAFFHARVRGTRVEIEPLGRRLAQ